MMHARGWTALVPVLSLFGCASAPVPGERLASAEANIRGAMEIGGEGVPQAALHLKLARDQVTQAKGLAQSGDNERAVGILSRAEVDAELALALARESMARTEANAVLAEIQNLRQRSP